MEKRHKYIYSLLFTIVLSLAFVAFALCVLAELKKPKVKDVKLDGKLCALRGSESSGYGMSALICFSTAQIIGNVIVFVGLCTGSSGEKRSNCQLKRPTSAIILFLVISWSCFGIALILLGTATSMTRRQPYGKGWFDGECYVVKDGIFIGAATLDLLSLGCTSTLAVTILKKKLEVSGNGKSSKDASSSWTK